MTVSVSIPPRLARFLGPLGPEGRRSLFSVAANALRIRVRGHLGSLAQSRHKTAQALGARPTGHLSRGARGVTFEADATHGAVIIPIAGISRAFRDVEIRPRNASALTLPVHASAYGHRVAELRQMGWTLFRPKGKDVLMGVRKDSKKDSEPVALYALKRRVTLRQDRTLLPSDDEMSSSVAKAMLMEITRIGKAC